VTAADRLGHDDMMMGIAELAAQRSLCYRSRVGAAACDRDRRLVAVGWNAAPAGVETDGRSCFMWCPRGAGLTERRPAHADCLALHAETNALIHAERGELIGGSLYVTRVPCIACARQIAAAGVARLVVGPDEGGVFHRPDEVIGMLDMCGVEVVQYGDA
jgi:dCMP deaminase